MVRWMANSSGFNTRGTAPAVRTNAACRLAFCRRAAAMTIIGLCVLAFRGQCRSEELPAHNATVAIDCRTLRPFLGFGLNVWPELSRVQSLTDIVRLTNANYIRWEMVPDLTDAPSSDLSPSAMAAWLERDTQITFRQKLSANYQFYREMAAIVPFQVAFFMRPPPQWRQIGQHEGVQAQLSDDLDKGWKIADDRIPAYAALLVAELLVLQEHGIQPFAVELVNEPQGHFTPSQFAALVRIFAEIKLANGLTSIKIMGPGTSWISAAAPFLSAIGQSSGLDALNIVSVHAWDSQGTNDVAHLKSPLTSSLASDSAKPLYITEFGLELQEWYRAPFDAGPRKRGGTRNAADSPLFAVKTLGQAAALLNDGASAVFYWQAQDQGWWYDAWGLEDIRNVPRPIEDAFRFLFERVSNKDKIPHTESSLSYLLSLDFLNAGRHSLFLVNSSTQALHVDISSQGCGVFSKVAAAAWPANTEVSADKDSNSEVVVPVLPGNSIARLEIE